MALRHHRAHGVSESRIVRRLARLQLDMVALLILALLAAGCSRQPNLQPAPTSSPTQQATTPVLRPTLQARLPEQSELVPFVEAVLIGGGDEPASVQQPGFLSAELTGRQFSSVSLIGGVQEEGRERVLVYRPIDPDPADEVWPGAWEDGVHDLIETWDFTGDYLWDGQKGDFVVLWTTDPEIDTRTVHGRYRADGEGTYRDAVLVVETTSGQADLIVDTSSGEALTFAAGDEFQLTELILAADGTLHSEAGMTLSFDEGGHLTYAKRPVPSGSYFLKIGAESVAGDTAWANAEYEVDNETLKAGYKAFLHPRLGFQLFYPETWPVPSLLEGQTLFQDPAGVIRMSVSAHPDMGDRPIVDLKQRVLEAYGDVSLLYEDQLQIGQSGGLRTVYGYESASGPRTGILLTYSQDGQPFVVDIDGPASEEAKLQELAGIVADSWVIRQIVADEDGSWVNASVDGLQVTVPSSHRSQQLSNGWYRFGGEGDLTFIALRSEAAAGRGLFEGLDHWLNVAGNNVNDYSASSVYAHERGERSWARLDFEYTLDSGEHVAGAIMITRIGDRFMVIWAEAPADNFEAYENEVLLTVVDEVSRVQANQP